MPVEHLLHLFHQIAAGQDAIVEIGPVEVADQHFGIAQAELIANVLANLLGGRGRVGVNGSAGKQFLEPVQLAILRAKVMAPMADAMGLVDGEGADVDLLQQPAEVGQHQPLRRDEQQPDGSLAHILLIGVALLGRLRTVELDGRNAAGLQAVHLILHERDQGADHDGRVAAKNSRRLIAERLAPAGRHDDDRIPAVEHGSHRLFLKRAELAEAPVAQDNVLEGGEGPGKRTWWHGRPR